MPRPKQAPSPEHEIIVNDQHQYVVWPAKKRLPQGWRYLGKSGTKDELAYYLKEMFVETVPALLVVNDRSTSESRWG
jgi:MbtH protein